MKFMRRPDLDSPTRIHIAIQAYFALGIYGEITRLANLYNVSRLFIYQLLWKLLALFETESPTASPDEAERKLLDCHILLLRLQGRCSLGDISQILSHLGFSFHSVGYISQRILAFARSLPHDLPAGLKVTFYLSDEIYSGSRPILITIDAKSLAILKIELASCRDAEQWKQHWQALAEAGYIENKYVVSDLGKGLVKGCALLCITHHPDLFHLLHPIAVFVSRFERQAYSAIEKEYQRKKVFENAKSEEVLHKKLDLYEKAKAIAEKAIEQYDDFCYLWQQLRMAFDLFDSQGNFKDPQKNLEEVLTILDLMRSLNCEGLNKEIQTLKNALEAYWGYFQRAEMIYRELAQTYSQEPLKPICLAWQYQKQAKNSKIYKVQQYLKNEAQFYLDFAQSINPTQFEEIKSNVFEGFDANIRSSSLIENINSSLRELLDTCRGQVTQELLNLFAYVHNHRPFLRGERQNLAPIEILTGKPLETSWIDSLLDSVY